MTEIGLELSNGDRVMLWHSLEGALTSVGSNPDCDLCVPDSAVAPVQMLLCRTGDRVELRNRNSDGTGVNGSPVVESQRLADGDCIALGPLSATVRYLREPSRHGGGTRTLARPGDQAPESLLLELKNGDRYSLTPAGLAVGTDPDNDVVLDDSYVSGFHARFALEEGRATVRDLGSRNGIFVEGRRIGEGEVPLNGIVYVGKTGVRVVRSAAAPDRATTPFVGESTAAQRVRELVRRIAAHDAPVLITGETGTGKEVIARRLREQSSRFDAPYVPLNCAALGRNLIESELFGHEKGAFTGATQQKAGAFEAAHRGTLFLDEIGELPMELQPQLLRVVEYGEVRRLGATESFQVDVRLLAATNRNLGQEVAAGRFREDLFHRLNVLAIEAPPLRVRAKDVLALADFFISLFARGAPVCLSAAAQQTLLAYRWPGNVRELRNVLQRAVLMRQDDELVPDDITFTPITLDMRVQATEAKSGRTLAEIERDAIVVELRRYGGNKTEAATSLGVARSTIHRKVEEYGIDLEAMIAAGPQCDD